MMFDEAVRAFALLAAASAVAPLLGRATPAARHLYWHSAILATLALPIVSIAAPTWSLNPPAFVNATAGEPSVLPVPASARATAGEPLAPLASASARASADWPFARVAEAVWIGGSALVFAFLAVGYLRIWLIRRGATPAPPAWTADAAHIADRMLMRSTPIVLLSGDVSGPLTAGWLRPALLIPTGAEEWSAARREAVLAHELAHVARRDCRTQLVAQTLCVIHWFNPLAWRTAWRLQRERERACDDEALALGIAPSTYAGELLAIAASLGHRSAPVAALAMARRSELEGRLLAVLAGARPHRSTAARWAGVATVIALAVVVAGARTTRTADEPGGPGSKHTDPMAATTLPRAETRAAAVPPAAAAGRHSTAASPHPRDQAAPQTSPEQPEALAALLEALNDRDAQVREKAALVIGLWPDERAAAALIHALADPDAQVREKAAIGLALRRRPGAVGPLIAAISDPDAQVREKAAIALGMSGDERAAAVLVAAMNDPDPQVREKVASALLLLQSGRSGLAEEAALPAAIRLGLRALVNLVR